MPSSQASLQWQASDSAASDCPPEAACSAACVTAHRSASSAPANAKCMELTLCCEDACSAAAAGMTAHIALPAHLQQQHAQSLHCVAKTDVLLLM